MARPLKSEEEKYFEKIKILPRTTKIAIDAIALIVNKENKDTNITYKQLQKIMDGEYQKWKNINPQSNIGNINIVFDNTNSGGIRYIRENIINNQPLSKNCYALKTNPEVINYVSQNKNALGIIGVSWVSDGDDSKALSFFKDLNVLGISNPKDSIGEAGEFFQPYQAYIALKQYPLIREIYIISAQGRNGLGTGFAAFVASDKGQRIILKAGIMPATQPIRIVNLN
jgi:phosphate transport system substrate-binding protein